MTATNEHGHAAHHDEVVGEARVPGAGHDAPAELVAQQRALAGAAGGSSHLRPKRDRQLQGSQPDSARRDMDQHPANNSPRLLGVLIEGGSGKTRTTLTPICPDADLIPLPVRSD